MRNLVGFYEQRSQAEAVRRDLLAAGFDKNDITLYDRGEKDESSLWQDIKSAFGFSSEHDQQLYAEATRRGANAVGLRLSDENAASADRAIPIMQQHQPIDLEKQSEQWRQEGWKGYEHRQSQAATTPTATTPTAAAQTTTTRRTGGQTSEGKEVIPVLEEQLQVGKRQVLGGGVRIHSYVTERPVEEQVELRKERVHVERQRVDRPVSDTDQAFRERTVEATETTEEPVVSKQARIVEEVSLNKDVEQRTETVRDSVRRTDVDVEQLGQQEHGSQFVDSFTSEITRDQRFRGRDWSSAEPEIRKSFEQRYPGNKWEQFKDTVHRGFEKARSKI